ncbi:hypothetical protein BLNAU_86 [Blattamonas nauphoetae]|uniref:Uncharacterized protein n=1 Tax=Blattamonas nauphoetae TaxID=2049346 RepID=A0ABQ9YM02_9EUKA|nr:hypothetical protein BLNAU_86 [Blattamonas nauphoetae]
MEWGVTRASGITIAVSTIVADARRASSSSKKGGGQLAIDISGEAEGEEEEDGKRDSVGDFEVSAVVGRPKNGFVH